MTAGIIAGIAVITAVAVLTLRPTQPAFATVVALAAGALLLTNIVLQIHPMIEEIRGLVDSMIPNTIYADVLLKALGIVILTQFAADVCRDAGETALAGKTELCGKILVLICGMPLYEHALSLLQGIIKGQAVVF